MIEQPTATVASMKEALTRLCPENRIDLAGAVALPCALPHAESIQALAAVSTPGMEYLTRDPDGRLDPQLANPWACTVLVFAQRYTAGWPCAGTGPGSKDPTAASHSDWLAGVSRYARGRDYHDVLMADIKALMAGLAAEYPGLQSRCSVDAGPYCEREYAHLAGLGFYGRNTCLIHERIGSGMFLGVALTNLTISGWPGVDEQPPTRPVSANPLYAVVPRIDHDQQNYGPATRCGRCTRCVDACPTNALDGRYAIDAGRCLSMLTIEQRGNGPDSLRDKQADLLFGCDICQSVCPWNEKAARWAADNDTVLPAPRSEYLPLPEHAQLSLIDLMTIDPDEFRRRFRKTPLWRCHPDGMRRNALTVAANGRLTDHIVAIKAVANTDPDPDVRRVARWALSVLSELPEEK